MNKLFFILFFLPTLLYANHPDSTVIKTRSDIVNELKVVESNGGEVRLHSASNIDYLLKLHILQKEKKKNFTGYRIQIHSVNSFGSNFNELEEIRNKFEITFQTIPAYLNYFNPDFKIRVGNYHSRLESIQDLHIIRKLYPFSYPVKTEISFEELKRIPMQDIPIEETEEEGMTDEVQN